MNEMDAAAEILNCAPETHMGVVCDALQALGLAVDDLAELLDVAPSDVPSGPVTT